MELNLLLRHPITHLLVYAAKKDLSIDK